MNSRQDWIQPGAHPVTEGVFRIPLPLPQDGLRAVNVYLIETDDGPVMIDGGWALQESRTTLEASLESIDYKVSDLARFLVTHSHRDHYTQAVTIRREFGSHVSLGLGEKPTLDFIRDQRNSVDPSGLQLLKAGAPELAKRWEVSAEAQLPSPTAFELPDAWLSDDHVIDLGVRQLHAISTPGHTQGHFVFADQSAGLLFTGDHVLPAITPSIGYEVVFAEQPLHDYIDSLLKVRDMPDMTLLPAHGPCAPSVHTRVDELLAHHTDRLDHCHALVGAGYQTAYAVAMELPWTSRRRRLEDLDTFNAMLATLETFVHLRLLAAQGRVSSHQQEDVWHFSHATE